MPPCPAMRSTAVLPALPTRRLPWLALLQLPLLLSMASAQTPYNPTRVLQNGSHLYVFQPSSSSSTQFGLSSIDISTHIDAAKPPLTTLYTSLPFLDNESVRAFTPVLDDGGSLTVYSGNCSQGASGGQVWQFSPDVSNDKGIGSWHQKYLSVKDSNHVATMGANYLNNGISFSSIVGGDDTNTSVYIFGGMCPLPADSSNEWQMAANYSNLMVTLEPSSKAGESLTYQLDVSSTRGPPVPEAGFTMTGLTPSFSNRSDGSQTQQRNFILIGGHTSAAFINMSQIALFSLPEEGWTFVSVDQPATSRTDLAIREVPVVDPRSGHTAVLTPDGQKLVVYGGWVGDINTPAEPQLAILNIADGYGGSGEWQWSIPPSPSGAGIVIGSGLYGHGAVMLPGGVMMVTGGYSMSGSDARMRRGTSSANSKTYFLNVTSNTWTTDYTPPDISGSNPPTPAPLSSLGQKAGLGIGIGMGLVCGLFAFYMWYTKRLQKQRDIREKQLQNLSLAAHRYNVEDYSSGYDGRGGQPDTMEYLAGQRSGAYYFPPENEGGQGWKSSTGHDAERSGLLLEIPSPTRGLRRGISGRQGYSVVTGRGPGQIHPIDELEEEDEDKATDKTPLNEYAEMDEHRTSVLDNAPTLDPFIDTHYYGSGEKIGRRSVSASPAHGELGESSHSEHRKPDWLSEAAATVTRRSNTTSTTTKSPDKTPAEERTGSNLSEKSARSDLSYESSNGSVGRDPSIRAAILNIIHPNPFRTPDSSPIHDKPQGHGEHGRQVSADTRTQSLTSVRSNDRADAESFKSAKSNFAHLQAEGKALLGGNPERARPGTSSTSKSSSGIRDNTEATNSRAATATSATSKALDTTHADTRDVRKSWLGGVRRVLRRSISGADRTRSFTATMSYHEPYTDNPVSAVESSATEHRKSFPASLPPRRAASDAGFWKSRRGKQDWEDEPDSPWARTVGDDWGAPEDIVLAEKERRRQEWRERGKLLVNLTDNDELPTPRTPIRSSELGVAGSSTRPCTPPDEGDWDVEAAVERRVVQVMFTVPRSKLRVVNADPDGSSLLSLPRENSREGDDFPTLARPNSPSKVKDLASRFEQMSSASPVSSPRVTPRPSPVPSPSASIRSVKMRAKPSTSSLSRQSMRNSATRTLETMDKKERTDE